MGGYTVTANTVFGLIDLGTALVIIATAIPLVRGRIPMNAWYGVRIAKSFESDESWYAINRYGGRQLIYSNIPLVVVGLIQFTLPPDDGANGLYYMLLMVATLLLGLGIGIGRTLLFAKRY
jgi:hypothetical protein